MFRDIATRDIDTPNCTWHREPLVHRHGVRDPVA